jgi:DNA-binding cell septation regulator SpoVG
MTKEKCKACNKEVNLRKGNIVWKLDEEKHLHGYRIIEQKNGLFKLELITLEKEPQKVREELAKEIVKMIEPQLQEQVGAMVIKSLTNHDVSEMKIIKKDIERGKTPKLSSRPGCVYLQTSKGKLFL